MEGFSHGRPVTVSNQRMKHRAVLSVIIVSLLATRGAHSTGVAATQEDESVRRAKALVVVNLDPTLPTNSLEEWMNALVGDGGTVRWNLIVCHGTHNHPTADYQVCVLARGETTSKRVASAIVWLGTGSVGHESWRKPHVEDMFVEAAKDSLTVERLGGLPQMLRTPPSRWPKADLRVSPQRRDL